MEEANEKEKEQMEAENHSGPPDLAKWTEIQDKLKKRVVTVDDFPWRLPSSSSRSYEAEEQLKYVGGVDVSFSKAEPSMACGSLVVLDLHHALRLVYQDCIVLNLDVPYIPGFLAFREAPILVSLLEKMKNNASPFYPQILMVDGNGLLHPRGFGLASHLGVLTDLPTIGIGKNAIRSTQGSLKPLFVSIGHRVSLDTAIRIVNMTCKFRVPEPIRQADVRSREHLRKHQTGTLQ